MAESHYPKEILKAHSLRVTEARLKILQEYLESKRPLSIMDFKKKKKFQELDESSIYRNISKLEEAGIIQSVPSSTEFAMHELTPASKSHHHHITCTNCHKITCLTECGIDKRLQEMAAKVGHQIDSHRLELFGICEECLKN